MTRTATDQAEIARTLKQSTAAQAAQALSFESICVYSRFDSSFHLRKHSAQH